MIDDEKCQPIPFFADPDPKQSVYGCLRIVKNSNSAGRHKNDFSKIIHKVNFQDIQINRTILLIMKQNFVLSLCS
jgi:hypothetical protein